MSNIIASIMVVVATLAPLPAFAESPRGESTPDPHRQIVKCLAGGESHEVTVSVKDSTVVFECPKDYTFDPVVTKSPASQTVYSKKGPCKDPVLLTTYCSSATLAPSAEGLETPGATLSIETLPAEKEGVFYVQCNPPQDKGEFKKQLTVPDTPCVVTVTVKKASTEAGPPGESGTGGGAPVVHICKQSSATVTVSFPGKDSAVHFQCEEQFNLYPADPKKVFKDDCKTVEDLKDMTRTQLAATASTVGARSPRLNDAPSPIYTLRADKKPPRKRLCYLCARQGVTEKNPGPAENYCTIYVESSARAQANFGFTLPVVLSCVLAVLHFM